MSIDEKKIARINELYHKSKQEGLTDQEKEEQARLRQDYINSVRANLRAQLNNINIQNEDGSVTIPEVLVPYMHGITKITKENAVPFRNK